MPKIKRNVEIVAEIGTAHNGEISKAEKLIDVAKDCGADYVKFQWVYADEILHPNAGNVPLPSGDVPLFDEFKKLEVPVEFYKHCLDYAHQKKLKWMCSPFGIRSLSELVSIKPDALKIASPELNHFPMLKKLVELNTEKIPVVVSSGVSTLAAIEKSLSVLQGHDFDVTLLHCITSYPAPEDEYNLKVIENLHRIFGVKTGVSDHSTNPIFVPLISVSNGAAMIEKHITLSNADDGLDDKVALNPENFKLMVDTIRTLQNRSCDEISEYLVNSGCPKEKIELINGDGVKKLSPSEKSNYERTNRSLHFMRDMKTGEKITEADIAVLRTEKVLSVGISPEYYELLVGKKIVAPAKNGAGVTFDHFIKN